MTRTLVDLLIFDRKRRLSQTYQFHSSRLVREYAISTKTIEDSTIINGRCDRVLGYGGHPRKKDISFGLVAIEVKKRYGLGITASAQLVAYLGKFSRSLLAQVPLIMSSPSWTATAP